MKGLGRKVSFLAVAAVIATALLGAAYTLWYENLTLNATVSTGTLDGKIICSITGDNDELAGGAIIEGYPAPVPLKDIGEIVSSAPDPAGNNHAWLISVTNAYPGYAFDCEYTIRNTGSVPWHVEVEQLVVTRDDGTPLFGTCTGFRCIYGEIAPTDPTKSEVFVDAGNWQGCQFHANEYDHDSFIVGINQAAKEHAIYKIQLKFQLNQWNESGWSDCRTPVGPPVLPPI